MSSPTTSPSLRAQSIVTRLFLGQKCVSWLRRNSKLQHFIESYDISILLNISKRTLFTMNSQTNSSAKVGIDMFSSRIHNYLICVVYTPSSGDQFPKEHKV